MTTSLSQLKASWQDLTMSFLWRQWSAIGVAGHSNPSDRWIIDPEALLLLSTSLARQDPRLFDEILDWLHLHGDLISFTRLKNLQKRWQLADDSILAAIAESLAENSPQVRWRAFSKEQHLPEQPPQDFFPSNHATDWTPFSDKLDPHFQKFGWLRTRPDLRRMSQEPSPHLATNLIFKTRWLFGMQSRAEIIPWLLTHESGQAAEIARHTAYSKRIIQSTLNDLESSGHILTTRQNREKYYRLIPKQWHWLTSENTQEPSRSPHWIHWPPIFAALHAVHQLLQQPNIEQDSELLQAAQLRAALEDLPLTFTTTGHRYGTDYLHTTLQDLANLCQTLNPTESSP